MTLSFLYKNNPNKSEMYHNFFRLRSSLNLFYFNSSKNCFRRCNMFQLHQTWTVIPLLTVIVVNVTGHGRVLQPPSRASAWRFGFPTPPNYDDDGNNCGGFAYQWQSYNGKCGICGDPYGTSTPRAHELGGTYGQGVIVAHYQPGSLFTATVELTAYHRGYWEFKLCPDPENNRQKCFEAHILEQENGDTKYYPKYGSAKYNVTYRLPQGLVCDHCVLQWRYTAGNNWGVCANGTEGLGCGNQEQFGACSDISIGVSKRNIEKLTEGYEDIPLPLFQYLKNGYFDVRQGEDDLEGNQLD